MRVPYVRNITVRTANGSSAWFLDKTQTNAHIAFFYIECVCNAWFTFEILVSSSYCSLLLLVYSLFIEKPIRIL